MQNPPYLFGMDVDMMRARHVCLDFKRVDPDYEKGDKGQIELSDRFESGREYGMAAVNGNLSRVMDHIQNLLQKIQAKIQWEKKWSCTVERFDEQCCEIIISSEEYYRASLRTTRKVHAECTRSAHVHHTARIRNHLEGAIVCGL